MEADKDNHSTNGTVEEKTPREVRRESMGSVTLRDVLKEEILTRKFTEFLENEKSVENYHFWWDVERFQTDENRKGKEIPQGMKSNRELGEEIYKRYFKSNNINVSDPTHRQIQSKLQDKDVDIDNMLFQDAQKEIYEVMTLDAFPRFMSSDIYKNFQLDRFKERGQQEGGIPTTPKRTFIKTVKAFTGSDAIEWSLKTSELWLHKREHAVELLQMALDRKIIGSVGKEKQFVDSTALYHFKPEKKKQQKVTKVSSANRNSINSGDLSPRVLSRKLKSNLNKSDSQILSLINSMTLSGQLEKATKPLKEKADEYKQSQSERIERVRTERT